MDKGTNVYVKSVCESKVCSCQSCKICQQMQKKLSLQCFPGNEDICDRHRGKKNSADKCPVHNKDNPKFQPTSCECRQCTCDLCKLNKTKRIQSRKVLSNSSTQSVYDPDDICERHRGRKKQPDTNTKTFLKSSDVKKPNHNFSKSLPPSPTASKPGRKLPKLKQHCECKECSCERCSYLYERPLSLHTLADPEDIYERYRAKVKSDKCHFQPICDCTECHCAKCQAQKKQVSLHSFIAREDDRRKNTDKCPVCLQIREHEKKSNVTKKPSCGICAKTCERKPKQTETKTLPPCDCKQCHCKTCKDMRIKTTPPPKYANIGTDADDICDKHRKKPKIPGECRLCKNLQETQRPPSILNVLNADRDCNCEVVGNAIGSMKYDLAAIHPLKF